MRRLLLAFMVLALPARAASLDEVAREEMAKRHIPGLSLAVLKEGKLVVMKNFGVANLETGTPVTSQTVYKIASLSKAFIADAILLLQQDGKLSLDDRASKYLGDAPSSWQDITIRQLLNHVSGIVRDPPDYHPYNEQPPMDVIRSTYAVPLASPPSEKYLYSNVGYYVLAQIITLASGQPWDNYIAANFFKPAGMTATRTTTRDVIPRRASGYYWRTDRYINAEEWVGVRPSGAFMSTIEDMARWERFQRSPEFPLNAESRALAISLPRLKDGAPSNYGFGWMTDKFLGRTRIHHDGVYPGFRSDYEKFDNGLSVILLTNSENGSVESVALKFAGLFDANLVMPNFKLVAAAPSNAQVGTPVTIKVTAHDLDHPAPGSLFELEIWDANGKPVFKQRKANEDFRAGESRELEFSWVPQTPGSFTVNVGAYGPRWVASYAWAQKAALIRID